MKDLAALDRTEKLIREISLALARRERVNRQMVVLLLEKVTGSLNHFVAARWYFAFGEYPSIEMVNDCLYLIEKRARIACLAGVIPDAPGFVEFVSHQIVHELESLVWRSGAPLP